MKHADHTGSLIFFDRKRGMEAGRRIRGMARLPALDVSLGGVVQHSASMTHAAVKVEDRLVAGITEGLAQLAVGC